MDHFFERSDLTDSLKGVYDIERLASRVSFGKINPKDLLQLGDTLGHVPTIKSILLGIGDPVLDVLIARLDELPELHLLDYLSYCSGSVCCYYRGEISSVPVLTSNWINTVSFFGMVLVGLLRLKPGARSQRHYRSKIDYNKRRTAIISMSPILN